MNSDGQTRLILGDPCNELKWLWYLSLSLHSCLKHVQNGNSPSVISGREGKMLRNYLSSFFVADMGLDRILGVRIPSSAKYGLCLSMDTTHKRLWWEVFNKQARTAKIRPGIVESLGVP